MRWRVNKKKARISLVGRHTNGQNFPPKGEGCAQSSWWPCVFAVFHCLQRCAILIFFTNSSEIKSLRTIRMLLKNVFGLWQGVDVNIISVRFSICENRTPRSSITSLMLEWGPGQCVCWDKLWPVWSYLHKNQSTLDSTYSTQINSIFYWKNLFAECPESYVVWDGTRGLYKKICKLWVNIHNTFTLLFTIHLHIFLQYIYIFV